MTLPTSPAEPRETAGRLIVLGIGNILLQDDAVGVHAVRLLSERADLPGDTEIVDGGTGGLSLLPIIQDASALILVDAVDRGSQPGEIHVLTGSALHTSPARLSIHEVGASDLVAAARLTGILPELTVLIGIQPHTIAPGLDLTPPVAAALPHLVETVLRWCHAAYEKTAVSRYVSPSSRTE